MSYQKTISELIYLAKLVDESSDAIFSKGIDHTIISWNKGAEQLFGYSKEDTIGKSSIGLGIYKLTEDELGFIIQHLTENGTWQSELDFYKKSGETFTGSVTGNLIKGDDGEIVSYYFIVKDISQQKKNEYELKEANEELEATIYIRNKELKQSSDIYRNIFQNSPTPMWIYDLTTYKFLEVNDIALKEYGYSRDEFLSMNLLRISPDSEIERFLTLDRSAQTRYVENYPIGIWKHKRKDGSLLDVEISTHLIKYKGHDAKLVLANNITQRLEAEKLLTANENRFRALIENSLDGITLMDENINIIYRSPSTERITGWSENEINGKLGSINIHPDDLKAVQQIHPLLLSEPGKLFPVKYRNLHKNGEYRWLEGTLINLLHDKNVHAIVFNYRDVTERKEAEDIIAVNEKKFRALIENSNDAIILLDENFKMKFRSPSTTRITGWTDEDMLHIGDSGHVHPEDIEFLKQNTIDVLNNPGIIFNSCYRNLHKNGEYRWLEGTIVNLLHDEEVKSIVINYSDITERKKTEQKLIQSEYQLRYSLDNMIEGVQIIDYNWRYVYVNDSLVADSKYNREELIGFTMMERYPGIENTEMFTLLKECMEEQKKGFIENEFTFPDGSKEYFELSIQPVPEGVFILSLNITERKKAQTELAASELKFRSLLENSNDIITMLDDDYKILYRSPSATKLLGWTDEDMLGIKGIDNIHPEDRMIFLESINTSQKSHGIYKDVSFRMRHKKGHYLIIEGSIINLLEDKNIHAFVFNFRDVTARKESDERIAANELRFRTLIENGNDIVSMFDENFNVIYRSASAARVTGWTDEIIVGDKGTRNIHPDDIQYATNNIQKIKANPGIPENVSFRMKHFNGHYIWVEGVIINLLKNKNIKAIVFNFRDITEAKKSADELKASELQYRNLIDRISDGFMSLDNELRITYVNNVAEKMFDTPSGYLTGKKLYEEYSNGIDSVIYNSIVESLKTKKPKRVDTYSDVFQKWIIGSIYPSSTGLTCFYRDNTEYKKMEQELQEQQHQEQSKLISATLEAQEKERNAIGIELHDNVNQILVGTTMFLSMLKKKPEKDDELITECIDHIKQAINENRKIAHILVSPDMGNKHLTEQISSLCGNMLQANGIKTIANFDDYNYRLLSKDMKVALYRIVQEQFTNIIKYAEAKEVNIKLETTNKLLRMRIADNGKGMDGDTFTHGIGLRNIGSRLSVFGGDMKVKTSSGKGFELVVEIPLN